MNAVEVAGLAKRFGGITAVSDVSFTVAEGELLTLLGPSGCGKSTTLRCIAGLETPEAGEIRVGGQVVTSAEKYRHLPPERRQLGMVFQFYAVWPHMTCYENVAFPLRLRKLAREEIERRVNRALEMVQLTGMAKRYPHQLSGGQQQRVALARSLVYDPKVLLLDEPLSNLDAQLREQMRLEIRALQKRLGITLIYVTHDQVEAMAISNRVAVMLSGKIVQIGTPREIYFHPANRFVANFVGTTNLIMGQVVEAKDNCVLVRSPHGLCMTVSTGVSLSSTVSVTIRPERLRLSRERADDMSNIWEGTITDQTFLGNATDYTVKMVGQELQVLTSDSFEVGERVFVSASPEDFSIVEEDQ